MTANAERKEAQNRLLVGYISQENLTQNTNLEHNQKYQGTTNRSSAKFETGMPHRINPTETG